MSTWNVVSDALKEALHACGLGQPIHGSTSVGIFNLHAEQLCFCALLFDVTLDLQQLPLVLGLLLLQAIHAVCCLLDDLLQDLSSRALRTPDARTPPKHHTVQRCQ